MGWPDRTRTRVHLLTGILSIAEACGSPSSSDVNVVDRHVAALTAEVVRDHMRAQPAFAGASARARVTARWWTPTWERRQAADRSGHHERLPVLSSVHTRLARRAMLP